MFEGATSFNSNLAWNTSAVQDMSYMFRQASSYNGNINLWDVSSVENMKGMFYGAISFNQRLHDWDVINVRDMSSMFLFATSFNQAIWTWKVNKVDDMTNMFYSALSFDQDLTSWCVENISSEPNGFAINSPLQSVHKPIWGNCREAELNSIGCLECDQFAIGEWLSFRGDSVLVVDRLCLIQ